MGKSSVGLALAVVVGLASAGWLRAESRGAIERRPLLEFLFENLGRLSKLRRQLDMTPDQKERLAALLRERKPEIVEALGKIRSGRRKVLAAVRAEPSEEGKIREAVSAMTGPLADAAVLRSKIRREAAALLTPAQRDRLEDFIEEAQAAGDEAFSEFSGKPR